MIFGVNWTCSAPSQEASQLDSIGKQLRPGITHAWYESVDILWLQRHWHSLRHKVSVTLVTPLSEGGGSQLQVDLRLWFSPTSRLEDHYEQTAQNDSLAGAGFQLEFLMSFPVSQTQASKLSCQLPSPTSPHSRIVMLNSALLKKKKDSVTAAHTSNQCLLQIYKFLGLWWTLGPNWVFQ